MFERRHVFAIIVAAAIIANIAAAVAESEETPEEGK